MRTAFLELAHELHVLRDRQHGGVVALHRRLGHEHRVEREAEPPLHLVQRAPRRHLLHKRLEGRRRAAEGVALGGEGGEGGARADHLVDHVREVVLGREALGRVEHLL